MATDVDTQTVPVLFTTQTQYVFPPQRFMIPSAWKRYQLSQLVNKSLGLLQPVPFDFLVNGELLRGSLNEWCEQKGVGLEETLEVEFVESLMPPSLSGSIPHENWVSDASCSLTGRFVTASYDGLIRVFNSSQELEQTVSGHTGPITSLCILNKNEVESGSSVVVASSSQDGTVRLTRLDLEDRKSEALASLHLHTSPILRVVVAPNNSKLLTTGWDASIGVWDTRIPEEDEVPLDSNEIDRSRKRRKTNGARMDVPKRKAPLTVLRSHTNHVTDAVFSPTEETAAYSCSLDATIRSWDVEAGVCTHTLPFSNAPFLALAHLSSPNLLAAASTDRVVRVIDTRVLSSRSSSVIVSATNLPHAATPTSVVASPNNGHHLATGAYDGIVRIWDVRSIKTAISSFKYGQGVPPEKRGDAKVLGLDWSRGVLAVAGEAGLDIWRVPEAREENQS